ncbi:MAG: PEGA domain-containing protein [Acidobacteria bacterium]|nr:PEGA domain-containing protein [Acidobacteriota bacterium]
MSAAEKTASALVALPSPEVTASADDPAAEAPERSVPRASALLTASSGQRERIVSRTVTLSSDRVDAAGELSATERSTSRFTGALAVQSRPSGARVFVGGAAVGTTPII